MSGDAHPSGLFGTLKRWLNNDDTPDVVTIASKPPIERRKHAKAKRLKLNIRAGQVWLTVPPHATEAQITRFLDDSDDWLQAQLSRLQQQQPVVTSLEQTIINVPLLNVAWTVTLAPDISRAFEINNILHVPSTDTVWHIREHIRLQAKIYLPNRLQLLSENSGLAFTGCSVRHATTRWGSCSARRTISLNAALLLLPTALIDYVLLHELCHTVEMNHSAAFWQQMSLVMPDWQAQRHALKQYQLPQWWA